MTVFDLGNAGSGLLPKFGWQPTAPAFEYADKLMYRPADFSTTIDKFSGKLMFIANPLGEGRSFSMLPDPAWVHLAMRIQGLPDAAKADGLLVPTAQEVRTALSFALLLAEEGLPVPLVGPANDGGVAFEWELPQRRSIYCYARAAKVEVAAFDSEREYVDIAAPAVAASRIVGALLPLEQWT
jgi:hypothetical protein